MGKKTNFIFTEESVTQYLYIYLYVLLKYMQYFSTTFHSIQQHYKHLTRREKRSEQQQLAA